MKKPEASDNEPEAPGVSPQGLSSTPWGLSLENVYGWVGVVRALAKAVGTLHTPKELVKACCCCFGLFLKEDLKIREPKGHYWMLELNSRLLVFDSWVTPSSALGLLLPGPAAWDHSWQCSGKHV